MSPRNNLSVLELQYFKDEVYRLSKVIKDVIDPDAINNQKVLDKKFKEVSQVFSELSELAQDLGASSFENYFNDFKEILDLATAAANVRANKKVYLMCLDYQELLENLSQSMHNNERLQGSLKAFEVLTFKQDRLKRGEFNSLTQDGLDSTKKQRTM